MLTWNLVSESNVSVHTDATSIVEKSGYGGQHNVLLRQ